MKKEEYVNVEVELDNDTFFKLAWKAHEQDITFNELCRQILEKKLNKLET